MKIATKSSIVFDGIIGTTHIYSKPLFNMMCKITQALSNKYPNVALKKENSFVDDLYDGILAYMEMLSYDENEATDTFVKIINESDITFEKLRFDKNPLMSDVFEQLNTNIDNNFYRE